MRPLKTTIRQLRFVIPVVVCAIVSAGSAFGAEPDGDAAQALAKKSNCFKCHSIVEEATREVRERFDARLTSAHHGLRCSEMKGGDAWEK